MNPKTTDEATLDSPPDSLNQVMEAAQPTDDGWEPWRIWFAQNFFTTLQGMTAPVWYRELWRNRLRVNPRYLARALLISISSPVNSRFAAADDRVYGEAIAATEIQPPIFILGHWRSGTTLLQRYFTMDDRFSYPTFYQCVFPRGFLHSQEKNAKAWSDFLPKTRIFDNMTNDFHSAAEDEFALCSLTGCSPYMAWTFPRHWDNYDKYLMMKDITSEELSRWSESLRWFVQKIQYHTGKRVVLKSPPHTARIALLAQLFPGAKFIHIHRNPFAVYPSTRKMLLTFLRNTQIQSFNPAHLEERILRTYRAMYDSFFAERPTLDDHQFVEVAYEQLETDPLSEMNRIYQILDLPDFNAIRSTLAEHVGGLAGYQKNRYRQLETNLIEKIEDQWRLSLEEWPYSPH